MTDTRSLSPGLFKAIIAGSVEDTAACLDAGAWVNARDDDGSTLLHCAAAFGHVELIGLLLGRGASIAPQDDEGLSPLHCAVKEAHLDAVLALVAMGAPLDASDLKGRTPLHWAASTDEVDLALALIARDAPLDACDKYGDSPLHIARRMGQNKMVYVLIAHGAAPTDDSTSIAFFTSQPPITGMGMRQACVHAGLANRLANLLQSGKFQQDSEQPEFLLSLSRQMGSADTTAVIESHLAARAVDDVLQAMLRHAPGADNASPFEQGTSPSDPATSPPSTHLAPGATTEQAGSATRTVFYQCISALRKFFNFAIDFIKTTF